MPSDLLKSIVTAKSYSPDQPGDYAGGLVELRTKDFPTRPMSDLPEFSRSDLERYGEAFAGDWGPAATSLSPNASFGLSFGDDLELFDRSFGVLGSLTYSNSYSRKDDIIERVSSAAGVDDPEIDYAGNASTRSVSLGALANLSYELSSTDRITANFVYSHLMDDEARTYQGFNLDTNTDQQNTAFGSSHRR